jgi:hypothetical protein
MKTATIIFAVVQTCLVVVCNGGTNTNSIDPFQIPTNGYPITVEESGSTNVDALVRDLVSKRPAPYRSGYWPAPEPVAFADRYSTPEVATAITKLRRMGPPIFPELIKHLGDDRYSYSGDSDAWLNFTVSDAVIEILDDGYSMHSGYKSRQTPSGSGNLYLSFDDYLTARGAEDWAKWAKSKTRLEIQMDFIDWCIKKENERGYINKEQEKQILGIYEAARARVKEAYSKTK